MNAKAPIPMRDGASVGMTEAHEWSDERETQKKTRDEEEKKAYLWMNFQTQSSRHSSGGFFLLVTKRSRRR